MTNADTKESLKISIIIDNPRYERLPIVRELIQELGTKHEVDLVNVEGWSAQGTPLELSSDLYLLKSHGPQSLEFAQMLEQRGAKVINSWASTSTCQDRVTMSQLMVQEALPWPQTISFPTLESVLTNKHLLSTLPFPALVKSRKNYDGELLEIVKDAGELQALAATWSQEPIIIQKFIEGDGWDTKVWVIDGKVFAARRRSPLDPRPKDQFQLTDGQIERDVREISLAVGRCFGLQIYGVDFISSEQGPIAIDVNSFPGLRNLIGPEKALVELVERVGRTPSSSVEATLL